MRAVIQRVHSAEILINKKDTRTINHGLLVLLGIEDFDNEEDIFWLIKKISQLRIFDDDNGVMNLSVADVSGEIMVVSQFTLFASTKKGNRPSYIRASKPETAIPLYDKFLGEIKREFSGKIESGEFGAHMDITLVNNGPVTILIDTKNKE